MTAPGIVVVRDARLPAAELRRLVALYFEDMVKVVVDVARGVAAVGDEMHADAEQVLLEDGSRQADLWGANYYPGPRPRGGHRVHVEASASPARPLAPHARHRARVQSAVAAGGGLVVAACPCAPSSPRRRAG
ncbi:MAG TPA: DUF5674 family protein [Vicinamibacteria bacterium]|nr:DUF5674 family protein [Vicinamibacteria bacterium]